jgi:predicted nucleic acid-binding Zn ribbon protein
MKKPESVGDILNRVLKSLEIDKKMDETKALALWPEAVGPKIAANTRAVSVIRGRLLVEARSPAWVQECSLLKNKIKKKINDKIGADAVKDITFKVDSF